MNEIETHQSEPTLIDLAASDRENALILSVDGFEGPLDVLLILARTQKVDLMQISILALVEQYLEFVTEARRQELELAADYLVMAAWLAYLKSRLLLPLDEDDDEPSAEELAVRLQLRLQRLNAMRDAGAILMSRDRLGRDIHARGMPEPVRVSRNATYDVTLYELLKTYAEHRQRHSITTLEIHRRPVYALEDALNRLGGLIQSAMDWTRLQEFLPADMLQQGVRRSAVASIFAASLELARQGHVEIRQAETFGPLYVRHRRDSESQHKSVEATKDE